MIPYTILRATTTPRTQQTIRWVNEHSDSFIVQYGHDYIMWPSAETHPFTIFHLFNEEVTVVGIVSLMVNSKKFTFCICFGEDQMTLDDIDAYLEYHRPQIQMLVDTIDKEGDSPKEARFNVT